MCRTFEYNRAKSAISGDIDISVKAIINVTDIDYVTSYRLGAHKTCTSVTYIDMITDG